MKFITSVVLPMLEKELIAIKPEIAQFLLVEAKNIGAEILDWIEKKLDAKNQDMPQ